MALEKRMTARLLQIAAILLVCFMIDQISKWIILEKVMVPARVIHVTSFFNLTLGFNTGVSFGFFKDTIAERPGMLATIKAMIIVGLVIWAALTQSRMESSGLAMIAGGALGNTVDRWRQGAVTDFLDFHWADWHWPTFNFADVAIVGGATLMFAAAMLPAPPPDMTPSENAQSEKPRQS